MTLMKLKFIKNAPLLIIMMLLTSIVFKGCSTRKAEVKNSIKIGMMSGWPPYMSINKKGGFEGFDVSVANALGKKLGRNVMIQDLGSVETLMVALEKNKIDVIMSGLDITQKRQEKFSMVQYTGEGIRSFYLLFWDKIPTGVRTIDDLAKLESNTIAVEPATPSDQLLQDPRFAAISKKSISKVSDMVLEIKYGRSVAAILEPVAAQDVLRKNKNVKYIKVPLPRKFRILGVGLAVKKTDDALKKQLETAIKSLKKSGTLKQLERTWKIPGVQK